jgi:hypothetical protein
MADISNTGSVPSDIKRILDHSEELFERSIFLREQSKSESTYLQQLIERSLLLNEEGKQLSEWKLSRRNIEWCVQRASFLHLIAVKNLSLEPQTS